MVAESTESDPISPYVPPKEGIEFADNFNEAAENER